MNITARFPVPTTPFDDESLLGFIARACDRNGHPHIRHALQLAGCNVHRSGFVARDSDGDHRGLAAFFGCSEEAWRRRVHTKIDGMRGFSDYFGIPLRQYFRDPKIRRVSPAALRESTYHRAIWQIKPLLYCPVSGELLVFECPTCSRTLTWCTTYGVEHCEFCIDLDGENSVDLRSVQPSRLTGDDFKVYSAVADLLNPDVDDFAVVNPALPDWPRWEVFDMIVLIAVILSKRFPDRAKLKKVAAFLLPDWHENFMTACRAVLTWPKGFHDVIEIMREDARDREGYWGAKKEIGDLGYNLEKRYGASPRVSDEIEKQIDAFFAAKGRVARRSYSAIEDTNGRFISFKGALKKYGSAPLLYEFIANREAGVLRVDDAKRAPVYFDEAELEALMEKRKTLVNLDRIPSLTGITHSVMHGLIESGHVNLATGPAARLLLPSIEPCEIVRLENQLAQNTSSPEPDQMPLLFALRDRGAGEELLSVMQCCLDRNFHYSLAPSGDNILERIMVRKDDLPNPANDFSPTLVIPKMTARDLEIMLDIPEGDIPGLLANGCLKRAQADRRHLDGSSISRLAVRYMSHRCLARRLNANVRILKSHMAALGVRPAVTYSSAAKTPAYLWKRADIAPILGA
jgi:hypothetical protein